MEQVELLLRKGARCERERAPAFRPRDENERCVETSSLALISLYLILRARFTSQTRNKLREENPGPSESRSKIHLLRCELINYEILMLYLLDELSKSY